MTQSTGTSLVTESGVLIAAHVEVADTWWQRFKGLQFRRPLAKDHAILLRPCPSIHTFWMRFSIDVVFLDGEGRIVDLRRNVRPWRAVIPRVRSVAVVEMTSGALPALLHEGDLLRWSDGSRL